MSDFQRTRHLSSGEPSQQPLDAGFRQSSCAPKRRNLCGREYLISVGQRSRNGARPTQSTASTGDLQGSRLGALRHRYGPEATLLWVVFMDEDGACWTVPNAEVRMSYNWTMGRRKPEDRDVERSSSQTASLPQESATLRVISRPTATKSDNR
jgi:hypothetical protein